MDDNGSILLAEDEEGDVLLLQVALKKAQINTDLWVARDGQEAVDYLAGGSLPHQPLAPVRPELLLLDLKMPRMGGFEVLSWLGSRPDLKELPVVMLSSSTCVEDIQKARDLGAREYCTKPIGIQALASLVKQLYCRYVVPTPPAGNLAERSGTPES